MAMNLLQPPPTVYVMAKHLPSSALPSPFKLQKFLALALEDFGVTPIRSESATVALFLGYRQLHSI